MQIPNPVKKQSHNSLNQNQTQQNKIPTVKSVSDLTQGQVNNFKNLNFPNLNLNPSQNQSNNIMNTSACLSVQESHSHQNQNLNYILTPNQSNLPSSGNFPPKEYFNFPFFKRQMSSRSSDVDFGADNKEGLNDFFAARFNSVLSKDSSVPQSNMIKQSVDRGSYDFNIGMENFSSNLENKDDQSQVFLTRANSACLNKCSNYIPKTFYFQRHNSNTQSCFVKQNNIGNNNNFNNNNNLLLRYYGSNNEYNIGNSLNKNKFLDVVNDKDDENEDDDDDNDDEDGCILTNKEDEDFSLNYLSRKSTQNLTLPKTTFTLVHKKSSNLLGDNKSKLSLGKSPESPDNKVSKKKLPPVKTNTYSGSSKNTIENNNKKEEKKGDNDIDDEDKNNKNDDSEFMDESKSINDNEDKNSNDNNKEKKDNDEEEKNSKNSVDNIPIFEKLKFKSNKNNKSKSSDDSNSQKSNSNEADNFFLKKNNQNQEQNQKQNKATNNMNLLNFQNLPKSDNNYIQYQLNQNQNNNIYPQNYNSLPLIMGNMNQPSNNYPLTNEQQMIQEMQNLKLNNNYMNNFNNLNQQQIYRNNNIPINQMVGDTDDLLKNVSNYIKDQAGCRFIQKKIDENPQISNNLFEILYQDLSPMCRDLFGNYVVQKILENINPSYLIKFIDSISKDFLNLAISTYGTRVIQKILEIVSTKSNINNENKGIYEQCFDLINNQIKNNILELSSNNNSSHIIIKYVNEIRYPKNVKLFEEVYKNFIPLCKDKHGCCVIQKCIDLGSQEQKNKLLELSNTNCANLISDQFGNYVIQFVVSLNTKIVNQKVCQVLKNNLCNLCKEKYASNVIEKFLANKSEESQEVINILLKDEKMLHELIIDQFGNYIIQRILVLIEGENRSLLIHYIVKWYPEIKSLPFGPRLISKLHERYQEFTLLVTQNYGWDTTQETVSYLHLNGQKMNNNFNRNNMNNNMNNNLNNFNNIPDMFKNLNNNGMVNRTNNNNCMNFKNKSNVGNINFIQMNNYMLSPGLNGQNNPRFNLNNSQLFSNFNNINNLNNNINNNQIMNDLNGINSGIKNKLFFQRNQPQNYYFNDNNNLIQRLNGFGQTNNGNNIPFNIQFNNNIGNNNQNLMDYSQYLNMAFPNIKK